MAEDSMATTIDSFVGAHVYGRVFPPHKIPTGPMLRQKASELETYLGALPASDVPQAIDYAQQRSQEHKGKVDRANKVSVGGIWLGALSLLAVDYVPDSYDFVCGGVALASWMTALGAQVYARTDRDFRNAYATFAQMVKAEKTQ